MVQNAREARVTATAGASSKLPWIRAIASFKYLLERRLIHHHRWEDSKLFPRLVKLDPESASRFAKLSQEHKQLDDVFLAACNACKRIVDTDSARNDGMDKDIYAAVGATEAAAAFVRGHLEREEYLVIPLMIQEVELKYKRVLSASGMGVSVDSGSRYEMQADYYASGGASGTGLSEPSPRTTKGSKIK